MDYSRCMPAETSGMRLHHLFFENSCFESLRCSWVTLGSSWDCLSLLIASLMQRSYCPDWNHEISGLHLSRAEWVDY